MLLDGGLIVGCKDQSVLQASDQGAGFAAQSAGGKVAAVGSKAPAHSLWQTSGDFFTNLINYDPTTDPDAPYFRSELPFAARIAPLAATQAHPALDPRPAAGTLATTYRTIDRSAADVWRAVRQGAMPAGGVQIPRRLGVHDIVVQWSGTGMIPNPVITDVANRNGALCLGTMFQPDSRFYDGSVLPVEQVASKVAALCARRAGKGANYLPANADIPTIEQLVYSGQTGNPALDNAPTSRQLMIYNQGTIYSESETANVPTNGAPDQAELPITYGIANFITERSVIGSLPFATHFNLGEGTGFFINGLQVSAGGWFNLGIQDILPTWQWWRAPFAGLVDRIVTAPGLLDVEFDQTMAYDGGASLRVHGQLGLANATRVHLFKTDIPLPADAANLAIEVGSRGTPFDRTQSRIGLIFADQPGRSEWLPLGTGPAFGPLSWRVDRLDLRRFRTRRLAAILLGFEPAGDTAQPLDIRFGRIAINDGTLSAPPAPVGLQLDRRVTDPATGLIGLALRWEGLGRYDVFRIDGAGNSRVWIGRVDGTSFYNPAALSKGSESTVIEVQALGPGVRGGLARLTV